MKKLNISTRKWNSLRKKVIPYLISAARLFEKDFLEKSEEELKTAYRNLIKEKIYPQEIMHDFAANYNNLGTKWITIRKDYNKGFKLYQKSLSLKLKYEPEVLLSIRCTFNNMLNPALMCCQFDFLKKTIELLLSKYYQEKSFVQYLTNCLENVKKVERHEPLLHIAGMSVGSTILTHPLGDWIYFPNSFEKLELNFEMQLNLKDHAKLDLFVYYGFKPCNGCIWLYSRKR